MLYDNNVLRSRGSKHLPNRSNKTIIVKCIFCISSWTATEKIRRTTKLSHLWKFTCNDFFCQKEGWISSQHCHCSKVYSIVDIYFITCITTSESENYITYFDTPFESKAMLSSVLYEVTTASVQQLPNDDVNNGFKHTLYH